MSTKLPISAERFHYYDRHPTAEDLMGESAAQDQLTAYLVQVFAWLFRDAAVYVARNMNIYTQRIVRQYPLAPDIAVFEMALSPAVQQRLRSWRLYEANRPPPRVVFEIASDKTWRKDLLEKPASYAALGVSEYCLYDPNVPQYTPGSRLRLWRRSAEQWLEVAPAPNGRVWSQALDSWLVPDGAMLRLTDKNGVRRPTVAEAERAAAAAERAAKERALATSEAERAAAAAERAAKERAWAKLRELGIDPEAL